MSTFERRTGVIRCVDSEGNRCQVQVFDTFVVIDERAGRSEARAGRRYANESGQTVNKINDFTFEDVHTGRILKTESSQRHPLRSFSWTFPCFVPMSSETAPCTFSLEGGDQAVAVMTDVHLVEEYFEKRGEQQRFETLQAITDVAAFVESAGQHQTSKGPITTLMIDPTVEDRLTLNCPIPLALEILKEAS